MPNPGLSFDAFFEDHYDRVRRVLSVALGDPVAAEEAAQEAFTRALMQWRKVSVMDRPAGWVYVVAVRHGWRQRSRAHVEIGDVRSPDLADGVVAQATLAELLATLPERQRTAVTLRYLADLSLIEVADAMGCAVGTVKSTLHAALQRLRVAARGSDEGAESDAAR